jgi:drug/metabolite transporter (DMT)-like permease
MPDAPQPKPLMPSTTQPSWAAWVTIVAVVGVAAVGIVGMLHFSSASDAVTVLAPVTGAILALVGAFFGVRTATLAQQKANEAAAIQAQAPPALPVAPVIDGKAKAPIQ